MNTRMASRKVRASQVQWLAELLLIAVVVVAAARLYLHFVDQSGSDAAASGGATLQALLVAAFVTGAMSAFGLYQVHARHSNREFMLRLFLAFSVAAIALVLLYLLVPAAYIGGVVLFASLSLGLVGVVALRTLTWSCFRGDAFKRRILVYGAGRNADLINHRLRRHSDRKSFVVVGFLPVDGQEAVVPRDLQLQAASGLAELARELRVDEVVVAPDERRGGLPMDELLGCTQRGIAVSDLSTLFEREAGMVTVNVADPSWFVFSRGFDQSRRRRVNKRLFDLMAASALLLVAWPVMAIVALCVWLESGSPVLYRQIRVGEGGRNFELVKFRSMRTDAEGDGVARWASQDDDRSTRTGRFIRATRLDELPQLFNVLRGEMSFVGPRPERPQFVEMLEREIRYYNVRHCVKPGLTGWAQLRYPYGASVRDAEEKLTFDLYYVKNQGIVFDIMILLQTVEVVLFRRGAR